MLFDIDLDDFPKFDISTNNLCRMIAKKTRVVARDVNLRHHAALLELSARWTSAGYGVL